MAQSRFVFAVGLAFLLMVGGAAAASAPPTTAVRPNGSAVATESAMPDTAAPVNGAWAWFSWSGNPPVVVGNPFTFTVSFPVKLKVTDCCCPGDSFRVLSSGTLLGVTPHVGAPSCDPPLIEVDPDATLGSHRFSHGIFPLAAGSYSIKIEIVDHPWPSGTAFLRVDGESAVGYVFLDGDRDGRRDADETAGLGSVELILTYNDYFSDFTRSFAPSGYYALFGGRRDGNYCVEVALPSGYVATSPSRVCTKKAGGQWSSLLVNFGVTTSSRYTHLPMVMR